MTALLEVIRAHIPRDRYDDEGFPVGTWCICGGWEGDWFADGEAGAFDEHLAEAVLAWLRERARDRAVLEAVGDRLLDDGNLCDCDDCCRADALTALTAFVGSLRGEGK